MTRPFAALFVTLLVASTIPAFSGEPPPGPAPDEIFLGSFEGIAPSGNFVANLGVTVPADGLPIILFDDFDRLWVAKCRRLDCATGTDKEPMNSLVDLDNSQGGAIIETGSDGLPFIFFRDTTVSAGRFVKCDNQACTDRDSEIIVVGEARHVSGTVGSDGFPVLGYFVGNTMSLFKCADINCSAGTELPVLLNTGAANTEVAIGGDNFPVALTTQATGNPTQYNLIVLHCNETDCSGTVDENTIDLGSLFEGFSSTVRATDMLIAQDGQPMIVALVVLAGGGGSRLVAVKCLSASCDQNEEPVILSTLDFFDEVNARLSADDLPMIVGNATSTSAEAELIQCQTAHCDGDITRVGFPQSRIETGNFPDVAAGADGNPIVVSLALFAERVRFVHCRDPECQDWSAY